MQPKMDLKFTLQILALLLVLISCVPQQSTSNSRSTTNSSSGGGSSSGGNGSAGTPDFNNSPSEVFWNFDTQSVPGNLTVNENNTKVAFLKGPAIQAFLSKNNNSLRQYCLVATYAENDPSAKKQLRMRALPINQLNTSNNTLERLLRIQLVGSNDNQATCSGSAYELSKNQPVPSATTASVNDANSAFELTELCTDCNGIVGSVNVSLYVAQLNNLGTALELDESGLVNLADLDLRGLGLRIDISNNSDEPTSSCTNSICNAKGFDCCLNGQCVNDSVERLGVTTFPDYFAAKSDVQSNPNNVVNYPHIFFVCPNVIREPQDEEPLPDAQATADARFESEKQDFLCLEEGKKDSPDFASLGVAKCTNQTEFETIRSDVWSRCGCSADPFPTDPEDPVCPDVSLKAIRNAQDEIIQIECLYPDPAVEPTPFQQLDVNVSSRTAPHRFFDSNGNNVHDLTTITDSSTVQEGDSFSYLDESGKAEPLDSDFSINAILGQMEINLTRAKPAQMINIDFDTNYVISTRSGQYSPCPQCTSDSWFEAFTAFPTSRTGSGLEAIGYTTSRDSFQNNINNGNYEDTIFGRACWVPPTMLPFSHASKTNLQEQRQDRLTTQAALWINGYQRDWFGFNKGALIGSFDGSKWFAIGKSRRVTSTSNKLFLAINAPFADLADNTDHVVEIVVDNGAAQVAEVDYDTDLSPFDSRQNTGGSCQFWHQCEVDRDCVTKLGWEYACADVGDFETLIPNYDLNADEQVNAEISGNFSKFLHDSNLKNSTKRCVYRGAGSLCKRSYNSNLDDDDKKLFTCAPNFYCASLGDSDFNTKVVREPQAFTNLLFGQEADILGRPKKYIAAGRGIPDVARTNIQKNMELYSTQVSDFGICRPGKRVNINAWEDQHRDKDSSNRTDYISQIGSCDSTASGTDRIRSCPIFETDENQTIEQGDYILDSTDFLDRRQQNSCGGESKRQLNTGLFVSTFREIEGAVIPSLSNLAQPSLALDACFRRAGSICHTNLDCTPNALHAEQSGFFGRSSFGGTDAEKEYWEESLICGQAEPTPVFGDLDFFEYDMTKNRCCREIGRDFTMYTEVEGTASADLVLNPGLGTNNLSLEVDRLPHDDPEADNRYSRYSIVNIQDGAPATNPIHQVPAVAADTTPKAFQWKTINDTGEGTCCGGGWIRKFADGTNNWQNRQRLNLAPESFECLNYKTPLPFLTSSDATTFGIDPENLALSSSRLCRAPADGGCIQTPIPQSSGFDLEAPTVLGAAQKGVTDTTPTENPEETGTIIQELTDEAPFTPVPYENVLPMLNNNGPFNFMTNRDFHYGMSFYVPSYISGQEAITSIQIRYFTAEEQEIPGTFTVTDIGACPGTFAPTDATNPVLEDGTSLNHEEYCHSTDSTGQFEVIHVLADPTRTTGGDPWAIAGVRIEYNLQGTSAWYLQGNTLAADADFGFGMNPGSDFYYNTKLGRLELLGIPQIFYEPIYCNSNRNQLVQGIFSNDTNRADFEANAFNYSTAVNGNLITDMYDDNPSFFNDPANPGTGAGDPSIVFQDQVDLPQIFSGNDFMCCVKAGQETTTASRCCSGFANNVGGTLTCKIPSGTNLDVYFNAFVSSEGRGTDLPQGGLVDADFIPETGEPKQTTAVRGKVQALGRELCASGDVRRGGNFGFFNGQPNSGFFTQNGEQEDGLLFSIIDNLLDIDVTNDVGVPRFQEGFRWNHQFYCQ